MTTDEPRTYPIHLRFELDRSDLDACVSELDVLIGASARQMLCGAIPCGPEGFVDVELTSAVGASGEGFGGVDLALLRIALRPAARLRDFLVAVRAAREPRDHGLRDVHGTSPADVVSAAGDAGSGASTPGSALLDAHEASTIDTNEDLR